jgi:hypothetical protein
VPLDNWREFVEITLWHWSTHTAYTHFSAESSTLGGFSSLVFNPAGTLLILSHDWRIELWQISRSAGSTYVDPIQTQFAVLNSVISPDGVYLVSAERDGPLEVRFLNPSDWARQACSIANRNLTRAEWNQYVGTTVPYQTLCTTIS